MTYNVLMGTLNPTHSLTFTITVCVCDLVQVVDCGRFWAQNVDQQSDEVLYEIQSKLHQYVEHVRRTV